MHHHRSFAWVAVRLGILGLGLSWPAAGSRADVALGSFHELARGQYQVLAQHGPASAADANRFMNLMLTQYSKFFQNWFPKAPARVVIFAGAADFQAYAGHSIGLAHANLAGFCHQRRDPDGGMFFELVAYEGPGLYRVLAHEGFHQFIHYELGNQTPIWFNEGLAQYFETATTRNQRLQVGQVPPDRLAAAQSILRTGRGPSVAELIRMDRATFYRQAGVTYPLSWALAHYLMERDQRRYQNGPVQKYVRDLQRGRDPVDSFWNRFGRDADDFERSFGRYVMRLRPPTN